MADPILYSFRRCPYAMRARMALLISESPFELREMKLSAKPPEMIAASPKGTVPVLVLPGGRVIDESLDIMHWALDQHDPEQWRDGEDPTLIAINDGPFKFHLDRFKYPERHGSDPREHRDAAKTLLAPLEARLSYQSFLSGSARSLTDIALMPFIRQYAATDYGWFAAQPLPSLQRWLTGLIASSLLEQAMTKHPRFTSGEGD